MRELLDEEEVKDNKVFEEVAIEQDGEKNTDTDKPEPKPGKIGIGKLYSRQSGCEKCMVILGLILSFISGVFIPSYCFVIGNAIGVYDPSYNEEQ